MTDQVFGFDVPEDSPGFLLWQTTITWQRQIKKVLDPHDMSHAQFVVMALSLWLEKSKQDVTQSAIIRLSKLDKMTVSKALKKLVSVGLVKRAEHEIDTRAKSVSLTKKGKELISKLVPLVEAADAEFFGAIKKSELRTLQSIFNTLLCS